MCKGVPRFVFLNLRYRSIQISICDFNVSIQCFVGEVRRQGSVGTRLPLSFIDSVERRITMR